MLLGKAFGRYLSKFQMDILFDLGILLLGIYLTDILPQVAMIQVGTFTAVLFAVAKALKGPKCPPVGN